MIHAPTKCDTMRPRLRPEAGLSIVEVVCSVTILAAMLVPVLGSVKSTTAANATMLASDLAEERSRKACARLSQYLRGAGLDTLSSVPEWPESIRAITFKRAVAQGNGTGGQDEEGEGEGEGQGEPAPGGEWTDWEQETRIEYWARTIRLTCGPRQIDIASDIDDLAFSRKGRKLIVIVRIDTNNGFGDDIIVTRRFHVTLQN